MSAWEVWEGYLFAEGLLIVAQQSADGLSWMRCAGTPPEQHVLPWFVEDRCPGSLSYSDWAMLLNKAAMAK